MGGGSPQGPRIVDLGQIVFNIVKEVADSMVDFLLRRLALVRRSAGTSYIRADALAQVMLRKGLITKGEFEEQLRRSEQEFKIMLESQIEEEKKKAPRSKIHNPGSMPIDLAKLNSH